MCGICGILIFDQGSRVEEELIKKMSKTLIHRGPDDEGYFIKENIGFGIRRLSVIDLESGHQPIHNEDKSIWVVFNGEIYNFLELQDELKRKGHRFYTHSDTEVILHLYEDLEDKLVHNLNGMFVFAIWDKRKRKLLLARDRIGKKPLFYSVNKERLIFGSEIKSLLEDKEIKREVNLEAIHHYLTLQWIPDPLSIIKDIKKLPPAHILICVNGKIKIKRYWDLSFEPKVKESREDLKEELKELLSDAVRIRLISDVPLGVFLSGGIDSSIIVALMSKECSQSVKTFSIGFPQKHFNELKYARLIANKFSCEHHEFEINPDAIEILPKLVYYLDEPLADTATIPKYYLSKLTKDYVTVALTGDGGDETFAGYQRYYADPILNLYCKVPYFLRASLESLFSLLPTSVNRPMESNWIEALKRISQAASIPKETSILRWSSYFTSSMKDFIYSEEMKKQVGSLSTEEILKKEYLHSDGKNLLDKTLYVDTMTYLPGCLQVLTDRTTMAHSLEARSPFLDYRLVEFAAHLPIKYKLRGFNTKYLLKEAFKEEIPSKILNRPKQGFGIPLGLWFKHELKDFVYETLLSSRSIGRGYFKRESLESLLKEHTTGLRDHGKRLWALLVLELWHQIFIN